MAMTWTALTLPERIRAERKRAGMSLDRLAEAAGTSRQYLIQIEKGRNHPSTQMLERIAAGLDLPSDVFLGSPSERLKDEQRERLANALEPLVMTLIDELLSVVNQKGATV